jgi:hypothetical protein
MHGQKYFGRQSYSSGSKYFFLGGVKGYSSGSTKPFGEGSKYSFGGKAIAQGQKFLDARP